MNPPTPACREEMLTSGPPASPSVRYPLSPRRYLLATLRPRPPRPKDGGASSCWAMARTRRMSRTARALVWWIPFWYVVAQLTLFVWMDENWQLNRTRVEHDKWEQLHQRLAEMPDRPLVLMLGSSRTDWAFQAGRLSGLPGPDGRPLLCYNLAVPTTGPIHQHLYVNDLLAEGIRPRLLLLEFATPYLIQSRRNGQSEEHNTVSRWISAHQLHFMLPYLRNRRRALLEWLEGRLAPWYGFRWSIHEHLQGHHSQPKPYDQARQPMDDWGWRMLFEDPNTPEVRAWRWAWAYGMYADSLMHYRLGPKPAQAMRDLLTRCRREGIPVVLVRMPATPKFRALYSSEGRAQLEAFLAELRDRYGADIIDATDWLEEKYFDDGHHVLKSGAVQFSIRMVEEVQKVLARTESPPQPTTP